MSWTVKDTDEQKFPQNETELQNRLDKIVTKNRGNNIYAFVIPAFTLLKDCGLIRRDIVDMLQNPQLCQKHIGSQICFTGVLQKYGQTIYDDNGYLKYYDSLSVICEGVEYRITNSWLQPYKKRFRKWLEEKARQACPEYWKTNVKPSTPQPSKILTPTPTTPTPTTSTSTTPTTLDELKSMIDEQRSQFVEMNNRLATFMELINRNFK